MNNMKASSATRKRNQRLLALSMALLATIIVIAIIVVALTYQGPAVASKGSGTPTAIRGHGTATTVRGHGTATPVGSTTPVGSGTPGPGNQFADISDGNHAFDINRPDGNNKILASNYFNSGDFTDASIYWQKATAEETNDAEAWIYLEDLQVVNSGKPWITFVIGTTLTGGASNISTGRDNLQGAYVAQKQYNDGATLPNGVLIRLLIANAGGQATNAANVAQEIVQLQKTDTTIAGVMGWPFSSYAQDAYSTLAQAQIPMISSSASDQKLTGVSPYFFRVVPPDNYQADAGAAYAETQLKAKTAVLFMDSSNAYSSSLGTAFQQKFTGDGNQILTTENYTVGDQTNLNALLQDALTFNPALIYFAGYSDDMGALMSDLHPNPRKVQLMGGDALYDLSGYPSSARANFTLLHFTAFAYPDEWTNLKLNPPPFFKIYAEDFDRLQLHRGVYGFERADGNAILSYDAMTVFLKASANALSGGATSFTPNTLRTQIANLPAFQGVSGQISLSNGNGDPTNKAIVVLYVDPNYYIQLAPTNGIQGCFQLGQC